MCFVYINLGIIFFVDNVVINGFEFCFKNNFCLFCLVIYVLLDVLFVELSVYFN